MKASVGVIGGSGLYEIEGLAWSERLSLETPFGAPSGPYGLTRIGGVKAAFLARHGTGHTRIPSSINYRANIYGFKLLGVERIISFSAVGSLDEGIHPNEFVLPEQFFDLTKGRNATFFDAGIAAHVEFADPVCPALVEALDEGARSLGVTVHRGGCYVCIEGPQFSTRAESAFYRGLGMAVIGMTNVTEAKLAREAEICYATVAMVTDYDCWYEGETVSVEAVMGRLRTNGEMANRLIKQVVPTLSSRGSCRCNDALANAIITPVDAVADDVRIRLEAIVGRHLQTREREEPR